VGFIGAGLIAGFHARSLAASAADMTFAGVYDQDAGRVASFCDLTGATAFGSPEEVVAGCDAVYVCTWTSEHPRFVALAAGVGQPVFCEKPLAVDLAGAAAMAETVKGVTNQVGLVLRSSNAFAFLRHLIEDPESGKLLSITFHDDQCLPVRGWYDSTWRGDPAKAGSGVLLEHSIHDIDQLEQLGGPVDRIAASTGHVHGIEGIEDIAAVTCRYKAGGVANLTTVWHDVPERLNDRRVEVTCERLWAMLEGDWIGPIRWQRPGGPVQRLRNEELTARVEELGLTRANPDGAFIEAVRDGRPASPDFEDALRAHVLVDAAYRSAAGEGTIDLA
jgi:myo-inositol 2-dehydrogenase/D-chiro-inositol 1-dehydrogenase